MVEIARRRLRTTPVFDTFWRFAHARQAMYIRRVCGHAGPLTDDPILLRHRFTNAYRASDRVSQYLIREVIYSGSQEPEDVVFRTLLFKFFNRIETWERLREGVELDTWSAFDSALCVRVLDALRSEGTTIYSPAYVIPPPRFGHRSKHANHVALLEHLMGDQLPHRLADTQSLKDVYELLLTYPSLGRFLAFQFAIDLNYSDVLNFSEADHVVAGPGSRDGVRKCFGAEATGIEEDIIRWMTEAQEDQFRLRGIDFPALGSRALQLIDVQNLFCEVDKYARVAHPEVEGHSGRVRIKQVYRQRPEPLPTPWFPPKWGISSVIVDQA